MTIHEATALIQPAFGVEIKTPQHWADLGCGSGLFTRALAALLAPGSRITALDRVPQSIPEVPGRSIEFICSDFIVDTTMLSNLDGILMANSLHFVPDKQNLLNLLSGILTNEGRFIIIEYDTKLPNPWVPFPIGHQELILLMHRAEFSHHDTLQSRKSIYHQGDIIATLFSR